MNTHHRFETVKHHHFDWRYAKDGNLVYPESALMLVQTNDGQWFLQQEFGDEFSQFMGVIKSAEDMSTEPTFFPDLTSAARAAFDLMKRVYPNGYEDKDLEDFLQG